ncbi:DUF3135 domain-containing protein [Crenobacter cavernae]|uniref:DUF3135 domain-containing protein n=1 Tax=Crenobacter cavernae TaxID=2290923 RepID=A0A345Y955_9NEIS|nr:DUF3135 domain-containing protein [Crenobacter cavernae]AXK40457.1 DUF3135 domain-containing protein [Crenobacter cavernae]
MPDHPAPVLPDFDALAALYRQDPLAFEELRHRLLRAEVDAAPPEQRPRLEQTLSLIELTRRAAKNPMHAVVLANRLMWSAFWRLHRVLNEGTPLTPYEQAHSAKVLAFAPRLVRPK